MGCLDLDNKGWSFIDWVEEFKLDTESILYFVQTRTHDNKSALLLTTEQINLLDMESSSLGKQYKEPGATPMHYAAEDGHIEVVMRLMVTGSDPHIMNKKVKTPLDHAIDDSHSDV
ncbi:hypothetical protein MMC29_008314, partial [Sticta canariensis]|nr:hypothetical protein [Sticta canariensis]